MMLLTIIFLLLQSIHISHAFNFLKSYRFNKLTYQKSLHSPSTLKFITLDEVPLVEAAQSTDNIYMISEANNYEDLFSIVSLRVDVFYPDLLDIKSFHAKVLDKLRKRKDEGSVCLTVTKKNKQDRVNWNYSSNLVGTVEFSSIDFKYSSLQAKGRENKLYLMDLAVRQEERNKGIASSLLNTTERYAINNGYDEILLHVEVGNVRALRLYEKHGYEVYPITPESIQFTESRLHKPSQCYIFLYKRVQK